MPLVDKNPNYIPGIPNTTLSNLSEIQDCSFIESSINKEACGVITKDGRLINLLNIHPKPQDQIKFKLPYDLSVKDLALVWHSHFKPEHPSQFTPTDLALAHSFNLPILLYHTLTKEWDYYEPQNPNPFLLTYNPNASCKDVNFYTGWRFEWGRSDCFSLVRRYFLGTQGIDIGEFKRPRRPPVQNPNWIFEDNWDFGKYFERMPPGTPPQLNDIFGIALRGGTRANHLAVLVDDKYNQILHITGKNMRSRLDVFDDNWRNLVVRGGHGRLKNNVN